MIMIMVVIIIYNIQFTHKNFIKCGDEYEIIKKYQPFFLSDWFFPLTAQVVNVIL